MIDAKVVWVEPPPALVPAQAPPTGDRSGSATFKCYTPRAGVWAHGVGSWDGDASTYLEGSGHLSLWWPAAVAVGGNLLTLARR